MPVDDGSAADPADPWQMLAQGTGILVSWHEPSPGGGEPWAGALSASSALSQQLGSILARAGTSGSTGAAVFRVELPTGTTMQNLVPAVGGGFRGLVRASVSGRIAGHARLVPA